MTYVKITGGKMEIGNGAGIQAAGSDEPDRDGLSPKELLEAAVALCVVKSVRAVLERDGVEYDPDEIGAEAVAMKEEGVTNRFSKLDVRLKLPSHLDETYRRKLLVIAERACTIGNTIRSGAAVTTELA
ncbi:MAG: hypothetical protein BAA02_03035 [Paenibacillaceae bacterium ZCTH02-B3]|nr:MAG: hypothetical protein BAA02_03035 [Paenibacillaceae bacterium ZCTH02-B3]